MKTILVQFRWPLIVIFAVAVLLLVLTLQLEWTDDAVILKGLFRK